MQRDPARETVLGVVLAGGAGRRAGGADKGLLDWHGRPLAAAVARRLRPQVDALWIIANRNPAAYAVWADRVLADAVGGFRGPLEGIATVLADCDRDWALFAPVDIPDLPSDLAAHMLRAARAAGAGVAVAHDGVRRQVLCMLARPALWRSARDRLQRGDAAVHTWQDACGVLEVDCSDADGGFANLNDWPAA
ncbi:MAG: molybdenum cofactor guanylyltransferase MobA [Pseudomonadota bacterium]|jgi:molybdenum cofactor guanylyltransferase